MDEHRFDEFTKVLASGSTRRQALRGLLALALGGGLGLGRLARADAARCKPGKKCKANTPGAGSCGDAGLVCENGRLACPTVANATASFCNGTCTDPSAYRFDPANCGECGNACADGSACCDGHCIDVQDDQDNCGTCDRTCPSDYYCAMGDCHRLCGGEGGVICPDACYVTCIECGCFSCGPFGQGCGSYYEFCCPGGDPEACLGLRPCPTDTQRFIELV